MQRKITFVVLAVLGLLLGTTAHAVAVIIPGPGYHQLVNNWHSRCLDVDQASEGEFAEVRAWRCVNEANQRWEVNRVSATQVILKVEHSQKCLAVDWSGNGWGSNVVQRDCAFAQMWTIADAGVGWSYLSTLNPINGVTSMCLDEAGWDVTVWDCWAPRWQQWQQYL